MSLNSEQKKAIAYVTGPCLIIAGAGSGKTRVIIHKILHLIEQCGLKPNQITAVTFTNKAAREMQIRIKQLRPDLRGVKLSTFHTLGLNILKKEAASCGLNANFSLFDDQDALQLLKMLAEQEAASTDTLKLIQYQISSWKNHLINPQTALETADESMALAARFFMHYEKMLKAYHAVDFDDLILRPCRLFEAHPDIRERWQNKIRYFLVDEYQDTNESQYQLLRHLVGLLGRFTVVGDDDQSIYTWRGARPENCQQLQTDYPSLKVIKLEQNYRSTQHILSAANQLISKNPHLFEKKLWTDKGPGDLIRILRAKEDLDEAEKIIHELMHHQLIKQTKLHDYAILYRSNHQARVFEKVLRQYNIPYYLSGGTSFFAKTEIKDLLAYFRLLLNSDDDPAFLRVINTPRREIGSTTLEKLSFYAKNRAISLFSACFELGLTQHLEDKTRLRLENFAHWITLTADHVKRGDPKAVLEAFIEEAGYWIWLQETANTAKQAEIQQTNCRDFLNWLYVLLEGDENTPALSFEEAIQRMILIDMLDHNSKDNPDRVHLMTFHAAKGLEFPFVYLVGIEENILPHKACVEAENIEEERRLFYVGVTRTMKELVISYCQQRRNQGEYHRVEPSRFLMELPKEALEWPELLDTPSPTAAAKAPQRFADLKALTQSLP